MEINKQMVHAEIKRLIARRENRIAELKAMTPRNEDMINRLEHGIMTLLELEHNLRLCSCPSATL